MACNGEPGTALQGFVLFSGLLGATVPCLQVDTASRQVCCPRGVHILHENIQASIAPLWASLPPRAADGGAPNSFLTKHSAKVPRDPSVRRLGDISLVANCTLTWRRFTWLPIDHMQREILDPVDISMTKILSSPLIRCSESQIKP